MMSLAAFGFRGHLRVCALVAACSLLVSCGGSDTGTGPGPGGGDPLDEDVRWGFLDAAAVKVESLESLPESERHADLVDFLKSSDLIADAGLATETNNVWARFTDGRVMMFLDNRTLPEGAGAPIGPSAGPSTRLSPMSKELPASRTARLLNTLDHRWTSTGNILRPWLQTGGYQPTGGRSRLSELEQVTGDGVFYWSTHGGEGQDLQQKPVFGFWTESKASADFDKTATYKRYWDNGWVCVAFADADQPDGTVKGEWRYAITPKFVAEAMHFDPSCLVVIGACTSAHAEFREAFFTAGAGAYCGWDAPINDAASIVEQTFFDLLLAQDAVDPQNPKQRPFNVDLVRQWMVGHNKNLDPGGAARFIIQTKQFGLLKPTIFRIFVHDTVADPVDYIEIEGEFGPDPGEANRAVTIGGIAKPVRSWNSNIITVDLPLTGAASFGDVTVKVREHLSNVAHLTKWELPLTYILTGQGSLRQQINMTYILRGDIGEFRNMPFATPAGAARAISASKASTGTYLMNGIYRPTPETYIKWIGDGSLRAATSVDQVYKNGYATAAGNVGPTARTITTFIPLALAEYVIERDSGSVTTSALFAGIGTLTLTFDASYVLQGRTLPPVTVSDGTAVLSWPNVPPDEPFNDGGR